MKNLKALATILFATTLFLSCEESVSETSNEATVETTDETSNSDEQDETPAEEKEDTPQTVEERIQEIKTLYAEIQSATNQNKDCILKSKTTMNYDVIDEGIPFENKAKQCQLKDDLMFQQVTINGYEWSETSNFYFKDDQLFFTYLTGGAEACGYDYRVYYNKEGAVIRVLLAENNCDGEEVSAPYEVTDSKREQEILDAVDLAKKELKSLLEEK